MQLRSAEPASRDDLERIAAAPPPTSGDFPASDPASPASAFPLSSRVERSIGGTEGRLWVVGARLFGIAMVMAANVAAGRFLSKADFGELSVVLNLATFGVVLAIGGMNRTVVRLLAERMAGHDAPGTRHLLQIAQRALLISLLVCSIGFVWFSLSQGWRFTGRPVSWGLAIAAGVLVFTFGWHTVVGEWLRALHAVRLAAVFGTPPQTAGPAVGVVALVIVLALCGVGMLTPQSFMWANAAAAAMLFPLVIWGLRRAERSSLAEMPARPDRVLPDLSSRQLYLLCLPMLVTQFVQFLATQCDLWVAGWTVPLDDVGLYAAAKRIVSVTLLPLQFSQLTATAAIAHLHARGEKDALERSLRQTALLAFIPCTLATIAVLLAPQTVVVTLYGSKYAAAGPLLLILAIGSWLNAATGMSALTLMLTGYEKTLLRLQLVCVAVLLGGGYWAATRYGIPGLATVVAVSHGGMYLGSWLLARWCLGVWVHPAWSPKALAELIAPLRKR
jgi:O-antigen/teichoic acid export membrane protein